MASLEHISILVLNDLAPDEIIEMYFGRLIPHHWSVLEPLITSIRGSFLPTDFLQHLEILNKLLSARVLMLSPRQRSRLKRKALMERRLARDRESVTLEGQPGQPSISGMASAAKD
jgi:hypothetical protein